MKTITILVCFAIASSSCVNIDPAVNVPIQVTPTEATEPTLVPTPIENIDGVGSGTPCDESLPVVHEHLEEIISWQVYTDPEGAFHLHYPPGWRYEEFEGWVGFAPEEMREDVQWGLHFLQGGDPAIEPAIAAIGSQFAPERAERRDYLVINGRNALRVIVVTPRLNYWVSVSVFIEIDGQVYHFENGAKPDDRFHYFYCSFTLTK